MNRICTRLNGFRRIVGSLILLTLSQHATVAVADLVAYWPMDETSGDNLRDLSGMGMNTPLRNCSSAHVSGQLNNALHLDGDCDSKVAFANILAPQSFTVAAYIRTPSMPGPAQWVAGHGNNYGLVVSENGDIRVYYYNGSSRPEITIDVPDLRDGQWHHIAGSFNSSTNQIQAFVDGVLVGSGSGSGDIVYAANTDFHIGSMNGEQHFRGELDELKIFDHALSEAEVTPLLDSEKVLLTVTGGAIFESDSGVTQAEIKVSLSRQSASDVSMNYATIAGNAVDGEDFEKVSGKLTIEAGSTTGTITVKVLGDTKVESDETFFLQLNNLDGAEADTTRVEFRIRNDDGIKFGLNSRPNNTQCIAGDRPNTSTNALSLSMKNAFPGIAFDQPVAMVQAPGDDTRYFIVEIAGTIKVIENGILQDLPFLDISNNIGSKHEDGLYSIAFHPDYQTNGYFYISYVDANAWTQIDRFQVSDDPNRAIPSSEFTILERPQPFQWHNNYQIGFDADGYLYISLGDGGRVGDPQENAQNTATWLGKMLRIDVDGGSPYSIPADNPFADQSCDQSNKTGNCPEIYAWGLRSPWRWSFDRETRDLWLGDVGQASIEEINIIENGKNYGWSCKEGEQTFDASHCSDVTYTDPVDSYQHNNGACSVTGGYVYRGTEIPALQGTYLYGDLCTGDVLGLPYYTQPESDSSLMFNTASFLVSFAEDHAGELYVISYLAGTINKIIATGDTIENPNTPDLLSDSNCVQAGNPSQPTASMIPFQVNAPHWTDRAHNQNWLAIPDGTTINHQRGGDWVFPTGSVIMKNFILDDSLIETRFMMLHNDGNWGGYTYEWNDSGTDANLVIGGKEKQIGNQTWIYPSAAECSSCHTAAATGALAPETLQLNGSFTYPQTGITANQVETLEKIGLFSEMLPASPAELGRLVNPYDKDQNLQKRAKSWLHSNCSSCHQPGVVTQIDIDFRYTTPLEDMKLCNVPPQNEAWGITNPMRLSPGNANKSLVFNRSGRLDEGQMPPIGTNTLDTQGLALLEDWINSLNGCPLKLTTEAANGRIFPANGGYDSGFSTLFVAIPDPGYKFLGWSGDLRGSENPTSLVFDSNKTVRANFTEIIAEPGKGGGSLSLSGLFGLLLLLIQRHYFMTLKLSRKV